LAIALVLELKTTLEPKELTFELVTEGTAGISVSIVEEGITDDTATRDEDDAEAVVLKDELTARVGEADDVEDCHQRISTPSRASLTTSVSVELPTIPPSKPSSSSSAADEVGRAICGARFISC
jgi:hypothetical protein